MDELMNYRAKIGCFVQRGGTVINTKRSSKTTTKNGLGYTMIFLMLTSLAIQMTMVDPGIESNPGPTQTQNTRDKFPQEESKYMREIKSLNKTLARLSSHRFFNKRCMEMSLTPKTLYNEISNTPAKPNNQLLDKLQKLKDSHTVEALATYNEHYTEIIGTCHARKEALIKHLKQICTEEKFNTHYATIVNHYEHLVRSFQSGKCKKLNT